MNQGSSNRFSLLAVLITGGVIALVSSLILHLLDSDVVTVPASPQKSTAEGSFPINERVRSAFTSVCEKDVNSLEVANRFLENCDNPKSKTAFVNQGRSLLISWDSDATQAAKIQRVEQVAQSFDKASEVSDRDPEVAFYQAFIQDFKDFVINPENADCVPASKRYEKAIEAYSKVEAIEPGKHNLFIVNELGHFLTNRDRAYPTVISLYDKVSGDHPEIEHILMSKATAQLLNKDFFEAKDSFEAALALNPKAYQIKYSLGSLWASFENYDQALSYYQDITSSPNTSNFYYAWRDQGMAHYLLGQAQEAKQSFETALEYKGAAIFDKNNYDFMQTASDCLTASGSSGESCLGANPSAVKATLQENGIFQGSVIVHSRSEVSDPFFEVEHDAFYRCNRV